MKFHFSPNPTNSIVEESLFPIPPDVRDMFIHEEKKGKSEKKSVAFQQSISNFIDYVKDNKEENHRILNICNQFNFQRRRFYDVLNILEALGTCHKMNTDTFSWLGMDKILPTIREKIQEKGILNPGVTLNSIFPMEEKIFISKLTINFLLCFVALREQCLSLQSVAQFLSRNNNRFKTTLCKLYQIVYILVLIGVIEKRTVPSEVALVDKYYQAWCIPQVPVYPPYLSQQTILSDNTKISQSIHSQFTPPTIPSHTSPSRALQVPDFIVNRRAAFNAVPPPRTRVSESD